MKLKLSLFLLLTWSFLIAQDFQTVDTKAAGFSESGLDRYEAYISREIKSSTIPGAVSLIYRHGQLAHYEALGYDNLVTRTPMTEDKIFYMQSMTKPIISVAFMQLYEAGYFQLTDPVSMYIPEFAELKVIQPVKGSSEESVEYEYVSPKSPVQMWHLLSHTAGFSHGLGQNDYDKKLFSLLYENEYQNIEERVMALLTYPLMGHPGEQWNYSASPDVLAYLIQKISGMSTDQYLRENIFKPLGMDDTGYNVDPAKQDRVAGLHQMQEDGSLAPVDQWSSLQGNTIYGGTHGLFSTAQDYARFALMLLNDGELDGIRIISRKTLELMTTDHISELPFDAGRGFGLGFGVHTDIADDKLSGSPGSFYWNGAFNTYFVVDPEEDMVAILLTQYWPYTNKYSDMMRQLVYSAIDD